MRIRDIGIERSVLDVGSWKLHVAIGDNQFSGYFSDFGGFITAVSECAKFFAVRNGLLRVKDAGLTRAVEPGDGRLVLPGDRRG